MALSRIEGGFSIEEWVIRLASECPVSGNFGNTQLDYYGLTKSENRYASWQDYRGKKILDIGTGISNFVAVLLSKGADAYALDYGYQDIDGFLKSLGVRRGSWPSADPLFKRSVRENPQRYIFGSSHDLPFDSEYFDAVTSHFTLLGVTDLDFDLLRLSMNEAIRVLKPDGVLMAGPLMGDNLSCTQKLNQKLLIESLSVRPDIICMPYYPRNFGVRDVDKLGKLTIVKPS